MLKSFCLNFDGMYLSIVSFLSEKFNLKRVGKMELESKEDYEETTIIMWRPQLSLQPMIT